jgi:uncharacterized repeat protein (TIGR01451 family)
VTTGANVPDKGYVGYTARIVTLDTQALIASGDMRADCSDLRMTYYNGISWQELPRHVINCNSANTDIRFALVLDIAASSNDDNYYLYYNNSSPAALLAMTTTNVYLWFDDASINRSGSYIRGRIDPWHGNNWDNSLTWNAGGYYTYDTGNDSTSGYRRNVDERDIYVEAEFYHTGCYPNNITSGLLARGIIQSGSLGSEQSNHYYASNRGQYPGCDITGYAEDGDIVSGNRQSTAINGPNPAAVVANQWRRQGLAMWLINPTNGSYWDVNNSANWAALGYPSAANLHVTGTDNPDDEGRGFAAFMTAQDQARVRNILMRRYTNPEPALVLTPQSQPPALVMQKELLTVFDPVSDIVNPKAIPGGWVDYTITASNNGTGEVDNESLIITDPIPANVALFVGNLAGAGSGPIEFTDGLGSASSGLTYLFIALADLTDDVDFSTDGIDYSFVPTPDGDGFDAAVRYIRVNPSGTFLGRSTATPTTFDLRFRVRVQ